MFEGQPKGLYALALANTGERFGYYTMLAIFTLFLQAKFGYTAAETSTIFGSFLAAVYFMPLVGGILADKCGYGKMVTTGIVVMFVGYLLLAIPTAANLTGKMMMFGSLFLIACGTGLFKGNLQVMVGNLYDSPEYSSKRDTALAQGSPIMLRFLRWRINSLMVLLLRKEMLLLVACRLRKVLPVICPLSVPLI